MNLKPLGDRLVVEPTEQEETTSFGIVIPDSAKEKPQQGKILALGPGRRDEDGKRVDLDVAEGDVRDIWPPESAALVSALTSPSAARFSAFARISGSAKQAFNVPSKILNRSRGSVVINAKR